eukprot:TRINITY_DN15069_c0_g1_i7.p2 TRINITY_DN15069_c0_g1~~TRINITY_DN15069_c0_g1_i7.p2  ORF type:complete len:207 (+),score=-19.83 TRINITY_DN15069_c0_g1_i7:785-1405(+)
MLQIILMHVYFAHSNSNITGCIKCVTVIQNYQNNFYCKFLFQQTSCLAIKFLLSYSGIENSQYVGSWNTVQHIGKKLANNFLSKLSIINALPLTYCKKISNINIRNKRKLSTAINALPLTYCKKISNIYIRNKLTSQIPNQLILKLILCKKAGSFKKRIHYLRKIIPQCMYYSNMFYISAQDRSISDLLRTLTSFATQRSFRGLNW